MCHRTVAPPVFLWAAVCIFACPVRAQTPPDVLAAPDAHELPDTARGHLFGDWGGVRSHLLERGVKFDLHSISDSLWNLESSQKERFASYNRVRATVDIDLGQLAHLQGFYFHATSAWQTGGNLGSYLGLIANPTSLASANTFRLDSWWFEKRWVKDRFALRVGQFAGEDTYGNQEFGNSFVFEPMGGPTDNLFNTFESFDPPSTPALEFRVIPFKHFYVKSMVLAEDRLPYSNNTTGFVPQFRGTAVSVSEIGFTPGQTVTSIAPSDNAASRKGYGGVYRFGASYDPGRFALPNSAARQPGNYLLYWIAGQALWRADPRQAKGLDATVSYDWSPPGVNRNYTMLTAGLRFNEPLPLAIHNILSLGYVQNSLSSQFLLPGSPAWKTERGVEFNALLNVLPMIILQPVLQYYANVGAGPQRAVVFGFRTKVEF